MLDNLVQLMEDSGCIIIPFLPLREAEVDGATIVDDDGTALIFLNTGNSADRQRFTLAHELGHALMHRFPTPDMEKEANRFAAELLFPQEDMRAVFRAAPVVGLHNLAALKKTWKVSIQSILYRLKEIGIISNEHASVLWQQIHTLRWKLREPPEFDFPAEEPRVFNKLFHEALARVDGNIQALSESLCLPESEVQKMTAA